MRPPYAWLNDVSRQTLAGGYLVAGATPESRIRQIGDAAEARLKIPGYSDRFVHCMERGWISLSSPIWANFGLARGLPISCFGSYVADDTASIAYGWAETAMMSKYGGGTSAYYGAIRPRGSDIRDNGKSSGAVHFMQVDDSLINVISQGSTRRGNKAIYLPIDHGDVDEFLSLQTKGSTVQDILFGVCVPDSFMEGVVARDPEKMRVWARVLERRGEKGLPYVFFGDNANRGRPQVYKDLGMLIYHSNMCTEIMLPDGEDESFVCDLASLVALYFDEWNGTDCVEVVALLLDAVMDEFIEKARDIPFLDKAVRFAERHRALGIGLLGYHSYLQSKMIPWESMEAQRENVRIFRTLRDQSQAASAKMAAMFGEPEIMKGRGKRNTTTNALAPNKSSATIMGQLSESAQPLMANAGVEDKAKVKYTYRNHQLAPVLEAHGRDDDATWRSILERGGSVQHLPFLTDHEKAVFKTFGEISQKEVVIQAAQRQPYIDQGQSLNLMIHPSTPPRDVNSLMIEAWRLGIKSLYYQYSVNAAQEFSRNILACTSCDG